MLVTWLRPGRVVEASAIGVTLILLAVIGGGYVTGSWPLRRRM